MSLAAQAKNDGCKSSRSAEAGWKNSEAGLIPLDWTAEAIGDVFDISAGGDLDKPNFSPAEDTRFPHPIYANALTNSGLYGYSRIYRQLGDAITITARGEVGHAEYRSQPFTAIGRLLVLRKKRKLDLRLLAEFINERIKFSLESTGVPQLTAPQVAKYTVAFPTDEKEQSAIADALSDADALIDSLDALISKKRDLKQAVMQQLVTGKMRLPGFQGDWEEKRLGDFGRCLRGVSYRGDADLYPHDTAKTKRLLRSNNVQNAKVITANLQFVDANRVSSAQILQAGDVLICMANGSKELVGKSAYFGVDDGFEYTFGAFMGLFRIDSGRADSRFVFYLFQTDRYKEYINMLLAGSSINNLTPSSVESLRFSLPATAEQGAIAVILLDMDAELSALEAEHDKAVAIKQGMMRSLLTGRIRLL